MKALADFFGFLTPAIEAGLDRFPPTIVFHNRNEIVQVEHSRKLNRNLSSKVPHELHEYDQQSHGKHAFSPDGQADRDSRAKTQA